MGWVPSFGGGRWITKMITFRGIEEVGRGSGAGIVRPLVSWRTCLRETPDFSGPRFLGRG